jgi:hypothetical protein
MTNKRLKKKQMDYELLKEYQKVFEFKHYVKHHRKKKCVKVALNRILKPQYVFKWFKSTAVMLPRDWAVKEAGEFLHKRLCDHIIVVPHEDIGKDSGWYMVLTYPELKGLDQKKEFETFLAKSMIERLTGEEYKEKMW